MCIKKSNLAVILALGLAMSVSGAQAGSLKLKSDTVNPNTGHKGATTVLKGTGSQKADLVVKPFNNGNSSMPNTGVCGPYQQGYKSVKFRVKNTGNANADQTVLNILFKKQNGWDGGVMNVPPLGTGQGEVVTYPVPSWAQPGLNGLLIVRAKVDPSGYIPEQSDKNNQLQGTCAGPQS